MMLESEKFKKIQSAYELSKHFRDEFIRRGYGYKLYTDKTVKESKWWPYFVSEVDKFSEREEWDERLFIKSVFEKNGKVYPNVVSRESAWKEYISFYHSSILDTADKDKVSNVVSDFKKMRKIMEARKLPDYESFFNDDYVKDSINRNQFNGEIFLFMKSYFKVFSLNEKDFKIKKLFVNRVDKLEELLKRILGQEYIR
jgi:hypothetical protein